MYRLCDEAHICKSYWIVEAVGEMSQGFVINPLTRRCSVGRRSWRKGATSTALTTLSLKNRIQTDLPTMGSRKTLELKCTNLSIIELDIVTSSQRIHSMRPEIREWSTKLSHKGNCRKLLTAQSRRRILKMRCTESLISCSSNIQRNGTLTQASSLSKTKPENRSSSPIQQY